MANVKLYIFAVLTTLMLGIGIFCYQIQQVDGFRQYVDAQIERNGGLTETAVSSINEYSQKNYKGRYSVSSDQMSTKYPFGSIINYKIIGKYKVLFWEFDEQKYAINGSSVSLVR